MNRRVYCYFIATFLLGIVFGGVGVYYYLWYHGRLQRPQFNKAHAVARLKRVLNLSDPQIQQIDRIFDDGMEKMQDLQKQVEPQFEAIHQETRARIRQVLNSDQARKFDEFLKQIDARHRRYGSPPPPPPPR